MEHACVHVKSKNVIKLHIRLLEGTTQIKIFCDWNYTKPFQITNLVQKIVIWIVTMVTIKFLFLQDINTSLSSKLEGNLCKKKLLTWWLRLSILSLYNIFSEMMTITEKIRSAISFSEKIKKLAVQQHIPDEKKLFSVSIFSLCLKIELNKKEKPREKSQ